MDFSRRAFLSGVAAIGAALTTTKVASAGIAWCAKDPVVRIDGRPWQLTARINLHRRDVDGADFFVSAPAGVSVEFGGLPPDERVFPSVGPLGFAVVARAASDAAVVFDARELTGERRRAAGDGTTNEVIDLGAL